MAIAAEPVLSPAALDRIRAVTAANRDVPGSLIEVLTVVQQALGYLPRPALAEVARGLGLPLSQVYGVATFYSLFSVTPRGQAVVRLCESAPCHMRQARAVLTAVEAELGIAPGETTPDGRFSLELVSCLGVCGVAPVMMVNDQVYGNLTPEDVPAVLAQYR